MNNLVVVTISNYSLSIPGPAENSVEAGLRPDVFSSGGPEWEFKQHATYDRPLRVQIPGSDAPLRTRGRFGAPDATVDFPEQDFLVWRTESGIVIENVRENAWPRIRVHMSTSEAGIREAMFLLEASERSVDAGLMDTRVGYAFESAHDIYLTLVGEEPIRFETKTPFEDKMLLSRAKAFRKLKYLEDMFRTRFALPENIVGRDLADLDVVFRGITEGRFSTRYSNISFSILGSTVDGAKPPFTGPGPFRRVVFKAGEPVNLFGRTLDVGRVVLAIEMAQLTDPGVLAHLEQRPAEPINVGFVVLDHQVTYSFQRYLKPRMKKLVTKELQRFKKKLLSEEPQEVANLITEPLINDVSSDEAVQIVCGWLQFNRMPDRFCPQEPEMDNAAKNWRVPIGVVYPSGKGGIVADVVVDGKTGVMLSHPPAAQLRHKAEVIARTVFHG